MPVFRLRSGVLVGEMSDELAGKIASNIVVEKQVVAEEEKKKAKKHKKVLFRYSSNICIPNTFLGRRQISKPGRSRCAQ